MIANGNMLKQLTDGEEQKEDGKNKKLEKFNFSSAFDEKGNFIK